MMEGERFRLKKTGASHVDDQASLSAGLAWGSTRARSTSWPGNPIELQQRQEDQEFNLGSLCPLPQVGHRLPNSH